MIFTMASPALAQRFERRLNPSIIVKIEDYPRVLMTFTDNSGIMGITELCYDNGISLWVSLTPNEYRENVNTSFGYFEFNDNLACQNALSAFKTLKSAENFVVDGINLTIGNKSFVLSIPIRID